MSLDFSFPKKNRLRGGGLMRLVFEKGTTIKDFPLLFYSMPLMFEKKGEFKTAFGVSKKTHKKAVIRNKVKRNIREAYRLNKPLFLGKKKQSYAIIIVYLAQGLEPQELLSKKINAFFVRLISSNNEIN